MYTIILVHVALPFNPAKQPHNVSTSNQSNTPSGPYYDHKSTLIIEIETTWCTVQCSSQWSYQIRSYCEGLPRLELLWYDYYTKKHHHSESHLWNHIWLTAQYQLIQPRLVGQPPLSQCPVYNTADGHDKASFYTDGILQVCPMLSRDPRQGLPILV